MACTCVLHPISSLLLVEISKIATRWVIVPKEWTKYVKAAKYLPSLGRYYPVGFQCGGCVCFPGCCESGFLSAMLLRQLAGTESLEIVFPFWGLAGKQSLSHPCQVHMLVSREMLGRVFGLMFWRSQVPFLLCRAFSVIGCRAGQERGARKCS